MKIIKTKKYLGILIFTLTVCLLFNSEHYSMSVADSMTAAFIIGQICLPIILIIVSFILHKQKKLMKDLQEIKNAWGEINILHIEKNGGEISVPPLSNQIPYYAPKSPVFTPRNKKRNALINQEDHQPVMNHVIDPNPVNDLNHVSDPDHVNDPAINP